MPSKAFGVFNGYNSYEVKTLSTIFRERNARRGPNMDYGLLHGGLILLASGWETYCEDVSLEAVKKICTKPDVQFDNLPDNVKREILKHAWPERIDNVNLLETNLAKLPGEGWKSLLQERLKGYVRDFNTPKFAKAKGKNLTNLFRLYLSANVKGELERLSEIQDITTKIDKIITIRGAIAHKGQPNSRDRFYAAELEGYLDQVIKATAAIDCMIYSEFRNKYNITPWRMTRTVTDHLPGYN